MALEERKTDEIVQETEALTNISHVSSEFYSRAGPIIWRGAVELWKLVREGAGEGNGERTKGGIDKGL